jgi:hypothetical protein
MKTFITRRIIKYLSFVLIPVEAFLLRSIKTKRIKYSPVFIIGAPRTGSTILYQILTRNLPVAYVNNLVGIGKYTFYINFLINRIVFKGRSHNSNKSQFGDTLIDGLNAPHEAGDFWLRFLPKKKDYISMDEVKSIDTGMLRKSITAVTNYLDQPILFKNLNAGMRINLIKSVFPEAKFLLIKRDPFYTVQSILLARKKLGINAGEWWSVKPPDFRDYLNMTEVGMVVRQVFDIEMQILNDLKGVVDETNYKILYYENLEVDKGWFNSVAEFIFQNSNSMVERLDIKVEVRNTDKLSKELSEEIKREMKKYDWIKDLKFD